MVLMLVSALFMLSLRDAHAYLDPGSGSFLIQILIAGLAGAAVAVRLFWANIKSFFKRGSGDEESQE